MDTLLELIKACKAVTIEEYDFRDGRRFNGYKVSAFLMGQSYSHCNNDLCKALEEVLEKVKRDIDLQIKHLEGEISKLKEMRS